MNRPFKKPRPSKLHTITEAAQTLAVHRKDNSAWGKRMEKELASIEKRATEKTQLENSEGHKETESGQDSDDDRPIAQTLNKDIDDERAIVETLDNDSEDDSPIVLTLNKDQPKFGLLSIGTQVMKQFETGLFTGTVKAYFKTENLYKIEYSDGDVEDYDKAEYIYAYQFALEHGDHDSEILEDIRDKDQWSSEEESAYVLPKV